MTDPGGSAPSPTKKPAIVVIVALAVLAAAAVVAVVLTRGTDGGADWNALVGIDHDSEELVVYDDEGEETDRIDPEVADPVSVVGRGPYVAVTGDGAVSIVDVGELEVVWSDEVDGVARWVAGTSAPLLLVGAPAGGELRLVDPRSDTDLRLGEEVGLDEPLLLAEGAVASPDGTFVAASDAREPVTVVVDVEDGEARRVAGRLAGISEDEVVTVDGGGEDRGTAHFYGRDGDEDGTAPVPAGHAGGLLVIGDDTVLGVVPGDTSQVFRVGIGDDEPERVAELDLAGISLAYAYPAAGRLLVVGEEGDGSVLLDGDGETLAEPEGRFPSTSGAAGDPECFVVTDGDDVFLHDLDSGVELASAPAPAGQLVTSGDGCVAGAQGFLLGPDGEVDVDDEDHVLVAPDGEAALLLGASNELVDLTDADADPVELPEGIRTFVER